MPTVAVVNGIAIVIYYDDHDPPHFHAFGANFQARIRIGDGSPLSIEGDMRPADMRLLRQWTIRRRMELDENWRRARARSPLVKIGGR